jgi:chemotaxis signal transduction protein
MTAPITTPVAPETAQSFVLVCLGERRFAVPASQVAELVAPSRIFRFPHKSPEVEGVILRRGRMIPISDIADRLNGKKLTTRRFFLLATRRFAGLLDWIAIPVSGECELITTDMMEAGPNDSPHVAGWLSHGGEVIEVLHLSVLTPGPTNSGALAHPHTLVEVLP